MLPARPPTHRFLRVLRVLLLLLLALRVHGSPAYLVTFHEYDTQAYHASLLGALLSSHVTPLAWTVPARRNAATARGRPTDFAVVRLAHASLAPAVRGALTASPHVRRVWPHTPIVGRRVLSWSGGAADEEEEEGEEEGKEEDEREEDVESVHPFAEDSDYDDLADEQDDEYYNGFDVYGNSDSSDGDDSDDDDGSDGYDDDGDSDDDGGEEREGDGEDGGAPPWECVLPKLRSPRRGVLVVDKHNARAVWERGGTCTVKLYGSVGVRVL